MLIRTQAASLGEAVRELCAHLEYLGMRDLIACFDPLHPRVTHWAAARDAAPVALRPLVDIFLLGRSASREALAALPADALAVMENGGLLVPVEGDEALWLGGRMLLPVQGLWLMCDALKPNPTLYFGDDSIGLATRLSAQPGQNALDLCAGPGIQALRLAQMGAQTVAVEINPVAAGLARINAVANGLGDRIDVRVGSLFDMVGADERFDRITANPPLLPMPDDMPYPFVGHGGPDGLDITWRILDGLPGRLAPLGMARMLGTTFSDGFIPLCADQMADRAAALGLDLRMYVTTHHALHDGAVYFEGLAATSAGTGEMALDEARARYRRFLDHRGATHLIAYFLHAVEGNGQFDLIDVATEPPADLWFVV